MNKKEQLRQQRQRQEDAVLNKVLYWIVGAVVLEGLLLLLKRYYVDYTTNGNEIMVAYRLNTVLPILAVVFLGLFVLCAVLSLRRLRGAKEFGLPGALAVFTLMLAVCCAISRQFHELGIRFLYVAVPVVAVLALVYYLYQKEFFLISSLSALGILGVWMAARRAGSPVLVCAYLAVLAVILAAILVLARRIQMGKGVLTVRGRRLEVFPPNANYAMLYITCGVVAAVTVAALLLGGLALLYGVLVAWLLIMAVYYTVRMM